MIRGIGILVSRLGEFIGRLWPMSRNEEQVLLTSGASTTDLFQSMTGATWTLEPLR